MARDTLVFATARNKTTGGLTVTRAMIAVSLKASSTSLAVTLNNAPVAAASDLGATASRQAKRRRIAWAVGGAENVGMKDWPFEDSKHVAVITVRQIIKDGQPILYVSHDTEGWQFLPGTQVSTQDAMVVALTNVVNRDESLGQLADLPLGWVAYRASSDDVWVRHPRPDD